MEMKTLLSIVLFAVFLVGCEGTTGNKYNQLIVEDGNGQKYVLRHNIGDNYFISEIPEDIHNLYTVEANSKISK
jgi:hypothetical protein